MLIKGDCSQLEWRVKLFLSQDKVGIKEILDKEDIHSNNQEAFKLPTRLISKVFVFRMLFADAFGDNGFRGPAYSYVNDPDFAVVNSSVKFWEKAVEAFYAKYDGIYRHSISLIQEATSKGVITSPSGRFYRYSPKMNRHGVPDWPRTEILNYIVQGLSADLMVCFRLLLRSRLQRLWEVYSDKAILRINTVHDDEELDVVNNPEIIYNVATELEDCFEDIPKGFEKMYGVHINVPFAGEVSYGQNLAKMEKFKRETFQEVIKKYLTVS